MKKELSVFCLEILVPITLFWFISNNLLGSSFWIHFMDVYRPAYGTVPEITHTEKQLLHIEAENGKNNLQKKVLFLGSSSVVNGIDINVIQNIWKAQDFNVSPLNFGMTAFLA